MNLPYRSIEAVRIAYDFEKRRASHFCIISVPLKVCPLSNFKLRFFEHISVRIMYMLLGAGLLVTVNAHDPSYFGGCLSNNLRAVHEHLGLVEAASFD